MREILLAHSRRYPDMEVRDAVKLLYQSEFGGGHMIMNPAKSLERLESEYASMYGTDCAEALLTETIGDDISRIYLSALQQGLSAETLNRMFVRTADKTVGTAKGFERKLDELVKLCEDGELPFTVEEVRACLDEYMKANRTEDDGECRYAAVSHSDRYRNTYHPAYRVVAECYARYYEIFLHIDRLMRESDKEQVIIAIDGKSGSGKSTLGRILQDIYDCNLFHMDDYFLQPEQRTAERLEEPGGNVDYERFKTEIIDHLADTEGLTYQLYDCSRQKLGQKVTVPYKRLNIIEGVYSQHPYLGDIYDLKFFYEISEEEQISRIRMRNGEVMLKRFLQEWIPMENKYFEAFGIKEKVLYCKIKNVWMDNLYVLYIQLHESAG